LLVTVLFFLGIYNFAFKKDVPEAIVQSTPAAESATQKAPEKITAISEQAVVSPFFDKKSETVTYYSAKDGTVWQISFDGKEKRQIETTKVDGLKNVLWSPDHRKTLTTIKIGGQSSFYEYDHQSKKGVLLKKGTDAVAWDNLGAKIFYKYYDATTRKRSINIANSDGSGWQKLSDVDFKNVVIAPLPSTSTVSYWNYPDAMQESQLQIIGAMSNQPQTIFKGRYGGDYLWSPDGTQALVSSLSGKEDRMTTLGLLAISGDYHDLDVPTIISKCVWSADGKNIYYALPGGIPDNTVMPNDYQDNKFTTEDTFWKMNIASGQKERIIDAADILGKYDSSNLFLSATSDALYFVNKIDGKLYRIQL
jgi:hypothetical protein